jgi:putative transposase
LLPYRFPFLTSLQGVKLYGSKHKIADTLGSLREGLEKTLTVMRLDLPESLERVLSSTNLIENLFSRVREVARRVKRWQGGTMILRWTAAGVLEAERSFRKIAGYRALPKLVAALRARPLDRTRTPS